MPYLTYEQISELSNEELAQQNVYIEGPLNKSTYTLIEQKAHGMKGVVWLAKDGLGGDVALKIIPTNDYEGRSLTDEMTMVRGLGEQFAEVRAFGDFIIKNRDLSIKCKAIVTEWINGRPIDQFAREQELTVNEFLNLTKKMFRALSELRKANLYHDDLHSENILISEKIDSLNDERIFLLKVIDTGSIKRTATRDKLLSNLRNEIKILKKLSPTPKELEEKNKLLKRKELDDHLRIVESLIYIANSLTRNYYRLDFSERRFIDNLGKVFSALIEEDLTRRLDRPRDVINAFQQLAIDSIAEESGERSLASAFEYISAEMIINDEEFTELFSKQCPWLDQCKQLLPIYLFGPRGCGKSSILRWLSFKTLVSDPERSIDDAIEIGVYMSCSVELRSRFLLFTEEAINKLQGRVIRFFSLLLLEELFDSIRVMHTMQVSNEYNFGFQSGNIDKFIKWTIERLTGQEPSPRLQGQDCFDYLRGFVRKIRWEEWSKIKGGECDTEYPDPALISDICRALPDYFNFFKDRHITFLIDDYSNQRIPIYLQRKLNKTISFAKQGTPIFKVSSEYDGVDLEGIQEGREVFSINCGEWYTSLIGKDGYNFLADIIDIRLSKAKYAFTIEKILGKSPYPNIAQAIADANNDRDKKFYYCGINCIHQLCSGDLALALDLINRIFTDNGIKKSYEGTIQPHDQHKVIQNFSHEEIRRIKYLVPFGEQMYDIVIYMGYIARSFVVGKNTRRKDGVEPDCRTHIDVRLPVIRELESAGENDLVRLYRLLKSRAILFVLKSSRSRISGGTERLQLRKIYLPAFIAPLKRDTPIKIDKLDELKSLLSNPAIFAQREIDKSGLDSSQLRLAIDDSIVKPKDF